MGDRSDVGQNPYPFKSNRRSLCDVSRSRVLINGNEGVPELPRPCTRIAGVLPFPFFFWWRRFLFPRPSSPRRVSLAHCPAVCLESARQLSSMLMSATTWCHAHGCDDGSPSLLKPLEVSRVVEVDGLQAPHRPPPPSRRLILIEGVGPPAMGWHFFAVLVTSTLRARLRRTSMPLKLWFPDTLSFFSH